MLGTRCFFLAACLLPFPALVAAQEQDITLDDITVSDCNDPWEDAGVLGTLILRIVPTTEDDCGGGGDCAFTLEPGGIRLQGARLLIEHAEEWKMISIVDASIIDHCQPGCTRLFFYSAEGDLLESSENLRTEEPEELLLATYDISQDHPHGYLAISSCDAFIGNIWISAWFDYVVSPSLSQIKSAY